MIAAEDRSSSRAGSRLGQYEEVEGDGSVGGGNEGGGAAATTTSEPGERVNYVDRLSSSSQKLYENRCPDRGRDTRNVARTIIVRVPGCF